MKVVPEPVVGDQPAGADQLYVEAFEALALYVKGIPAQPELGPVTVVVPGNEVVIVTTKVPNGPFPQLFDGTAVTFPELPGVDVNVVPDPELGDQSAGAVQLKVVAFVEVALNVKEIPAQPIVGPVTVAGPGGVQFTVNSTLAKLLVSFDSATTPVHPFVIQPSAQKNK